MKLLGANLTVLPSENGKRTEKLTKDMIYGVYITAQTDNTDQFEVYTILANEILEQTGGKIDGFVQSVGSSVSLRATSEALRRRNERIACVAVEPAESAVLSGTPSGSHEIDSTGAGYIVPLWYDGVVDEIERVSTDEARAMAFRLAREEGLFCGTSTGANVTAALRLAERLGPTAAVVTVMCDTGMKYLKTISQVLDH
ncbi:hypothetical protein ATERTT37_005654 [Aspergillus terreus]